MNKKTKAKIIEIITIRQIAIILEFFLSKNLFFPFITSLHLIDNNNVPNKEQ